MNIKCYNTGSHSSILHFSVLYIFFCSFFPRFHLFFLMTSLRYCNVMNVFKWFIYSYFLFIWLYGIVSFFQSPDIFTSHNPLTNITKPSWVLSRFLLLPHIRHSPVSSHVCKADRRRLRRPPQSIWTASSTSKLIEGRKLPKRPKSPTVRCQVTITSEEGTVPGGAAPPPSGSHMPT